MTLLTDSHIEGAALERSNGLEMFGGRSAHLTASSAHLAVASRQKSRQSVAIWEKLSSYEQLKDVVTPWFILREFQSSRGLSVDPTKSPGHSCENIPIR